MAIDLDTIDEMLADQEKSIRAAFREFLRSVNSDVVFEKIREKLEQRDIEGALVIVDSYVARFGDVIPKVAAAVGTFTAAEIGEIVREAVPDIVTAISFDPSFPRAAEIVRSHRLRFVTDFSREQRKATMQALTRSFTEGKGAIETARAFRDSIGLNPLQEQAVANYRRLLEQRSRQALERANRDRRFDPKLERAIEQDRPLTPRQIDQMVDRYRKNTLQMRAETIARTEGVQATSEARDEATDQMLDQTGLDPARMIDIWNTTQDKRRRDWHATMNKQERPRGVPFTDGLGQAVRYPGDPKAPANTRINCRCIKTFRVKPPA